jgi:hypothetical protein
MDVMPRRIEIRQNYIVNTHAFQSSASMPVSTASGDNSVVERIALTRLIPIKMQLKGQQGSSRNPFTGDSHNRLIVNVPLATTSWSLRWAAVFLLCSVLQGHSIVSAFSSLVKPGARNGAGTATSSTEIQKERILVGRRSGGAFVVFGERRRNRNQDAHHDGSSNESRSVEARKIPQLLPAGFGSSALMNATEAPSPFSSQSPPFVASKFELQYTCNICQTRNKHRVSRIACRFP